MKIHILKYITETTYRPNMEDVSTKQVAEKFNIKTKDAYDILNELANDRLITKLEPVNGDKFSCCGWINNE